MSAPEDVITNFREAELRFKLAHAKAIVAHRGEGSDELVASRALVDCEDEYRDYTSAIAAFDAWRAGREDRLLAAQDAAADYHRSWAAREREWAAER